ncbi:hypothetical protein TeGR_g4433 [Tetraparma gracilis]|uniref:Uncharacterized protein n=1 Tax=Tetraparma gracilis TaxID=2962635 RepID=A0ABQ6M9R4_9STRA|nr:hypothetical protein TeGR_g4433 [Tetraparma gracilis]
MPKLASQSISLDEYSGSDTEAAEEARALAEAIRSGAFDGLGSGEDSGEESDAAADQSADTVPLEDIPSTTIERPPPAGNKSNATGLRAATRAIQARMLPWEERLDVTSSTTLGELDVNDDLSREVSFYNKACEAVSFGRRMFKSSGMPFSRPLDFFAEMLKSDAHMGKVKDRLIFEGKKIEAFEARKQAKEQKTRQAEKKDQKTKEKAAEKKRNIKSVEEWKKEAEKNRGFGIGDADDKERMEKFGGRGDAGKPNFKRERANEKYGKGLAGAAAKRGKFKTNEQDKKTAMKGANKEGKMSTEAMVKGIKSSSFAISVMVLEGNIMLLYLSQDLKYAAIASIISIFTETAGKAYVVRSTQALIDKHIKKGIKKGSTATAAAMVDALLIAGNEGGVNSAMGMAAEAGVVPELLARNEVLSKEKAELVREKAMLEMVEEELSKIVVELGEANKRLGGDWDEANILAMLAIRWSQEIIVEKTCIIYGAVATMLIDAVKSPHSKTVQLQLLAIFYSCEFVADFMFVFVMDGRFSVPLLRIPQPSVRSKQFWKDAAQGVFPLLSCLFPLIYAHHSVTQWIGDGGGAGGGEEGGDGGVT